MRSTPRDHGSHRSFPGPDGKMLPQEDLHIPAANRLHIQETILVNMLDHETDLIAVPGQHDARLTLGMQDGDDVAVAIRANVVRVWACPRTDNLLYGRFKAGRTGCLEKVFEER